MKFSLPIVFLLVACFCLALSQSQRSSAAVENPPVIEDQSADQAAIKVVVQQYLDVTDKKDAESIKKAFHADAKLLSVGKNGLNQMTQEEWWQRVSRIPGKVERTSKIALIDVKGIAAVVRIDFERSTDYLSLLKINDEWKIVYKTLSTKLNV
jgi:hypothetical protein